MRIGDLIEWAGKRWFVIRMERPTRTAILVDVDTRHETVADDLDTFEPDKCRVIANPADNWPFCSIMLRPKFKRLVSVVKAATSGGTSVVLRPFEDWIVADPNQNGGAIFFNPELHLAHGDVLVAKYEQGASRIQIPRDFLSTAQKKARSEAPPVEAPKRSIYERLRQNDLFDPEAPEDE